MQLAAVSELIEERGDVVGVALLEAADEVAVEWQRHRHETARCRRQLDEAQEREREARERLARLVRVARRMAMEHGTETPGALSTAAVAIQPDPVRDDEGRARPANEPHLWIHLLGRFRLRAIDDRPVEGFNGSKAQRLVRYLFAQRTRPVPRDVLIDQFWPASGIETGRRRLHQTVYLIRKVLHHAMPGVDTIIYQNDAYALNPTLNVWCDVEEFERCAEQGRSAEQVGDAEAAATHYDNAERCYSGDFLEDVPYEEWAFAERHRLRLLYLEVLNCHGDLHELAGRMHAALLLSRRLLALDGCDEEAHRRVMRCYVASGQRSLAVLQYRSCLEALKRTYGVAPSPETVALYGSVIH
jgi:DNA-binding SARP family transcriptional activator